MTSRQRVLTALSHREPDRIPYDLGGIGPSGIAIGTYLNMLKYMSIPEEIQPGDLTQRARPSESFLKKIGVDSRPLIYAEVVVDPPIASLRSSSFSAGEPDLC